MDLLEQLCGIIREQDPKIADSFRVKQKQMGYDHFHSDAERRAFITCNISASFATHPVATNHIIATLDTDNHDEWINSFKSTIVPAMVNLLRY